MFVLLLGICHSVSAQQEPCGFGKAERLRKYEHNSALNKTEAADDSSTFIIPVVVHIIHNGGPENIPDKNVYDQIAVLNEDFGKYGGGMNQFSFSSDTKIRFCLASRDPQGNPTTGIERIKSTLTNMQSDDDVELKNLSRWDPSRYMNVWIVKSIDGTDQTAGFAYMPSEIANDKDSGWMRDGIVMNYHFIGRKEPVNFSQNNLGHSLTHECGHYFDLMHTWGGDGPRQGGCDDDDGVDDTPDCDGKYFSKYLPLSDSCTDPVQCGYLRLIQDYMDYSEDRCMNTFTNGQKFRMRQAVLTYRQGLIVYGTANSTGCQDVYRQFNPANENITFAPTFGGTQIHLYPYLSESTDAVFFLFDIQGKLISRIELPKIQHDEIVLDGFNMRHELYVAMVVTKDRKFTQKIVWAW